MKGIHTPEPSTSYPRWVVWRDWFLHPSFHRGPSSEVSIQFHAKTAPNSPPFWPQHHVRRHAGAWNATQDLFIANRRKKSQQKRWHELMNMRKDNYLRQKSECRKNLDEPLVIGYIIRISFRTSRLRNKHWGRAGVFLSNRLPCVAVDLTQPMQEEHHLLLQTLAKHLIAVNVLARSTAPG